MADGKKRSIRFVDLVRTDRDRRVWGGDYVWPTQSGRQGSLCSHAVECVLLLVEDKRRQKGEFFLIHVTEDVLLPMTSRLWDPRLVIEEGWQVQGGAADYTFNDECVDGGNDCIYREKKKSLLSFIGSRQINDWDCSPLDI